MKIRVFSMIIVFTLVVIAAGLMVRQCAEGKTTATKAIDLTLKSTKGTSVKLSDYRGQVVMVDVWATWCGYCVREVPDLVAMQARFNADTDKLKAKAEEKDSIKPKLQIIGISVDEDKDAVKRFMKEEKINYPILYATPKELKPFGNIRGLPTKFILNAKGEIVETIIGARDAKEMEKIIAKYVK